MYRVCTAPGGGADPDWQKNKDDYEARRAKAAKDLEGPKGSGKGSNKDKQGTGKGKGNDKAKGKGAGKTDAARAAVDQELARASAAGGTKAHFPRQGIGLSLIHI